MQLYEVNTRCWLAEWTVRLGRPLGLADAPEEEFERWARLGCTHIWLMGVWTTGTRSRRVYLDHPGAASRLDQLLPGWAPADIAGSPYAISHYRVPDSLGGESGLQKFRERLHAHGLRLLLDFVPNHAGLDHPWVTERPEWFVPGRPEEEGCFGVETSQGWRWLAHGKDPWFPSWTDTAQLDYRLAPLRAAMIAELRSLAARCDGVRCDMAMLLLADVFARNWEQSGPALPPSPGEFWAEAIPLVRRPGFLFLAEAYWDLEERLQSLGFDFTYDKRVTDFVMARDGAGLQRHLLARSPEFHRRSVHFLENHDEPRAAGRLALEEHRAAALLILGLPGMSLLHEGQLAGAKALTPVQLRRRVVEGTDPLVARMYEELLNALADSAVGRGEGLLLKPLPVSPDDQVAASTILICWAGPANGIDLVVVNLTELAGRCRVELPGVIAGEGIWRVRSRIGPAPVEVRVGQGLVLEVPSHAAQLLNFTPAQ